MLKATVPAVPHRAMVLTNASWPPDLVLATASRNCLAASAHFKISALNVYC